MQTARYFVALGVSTAAALGGTVLVPSLSLAQAEPTAGMPSANLPLGHLHATEQAQTNLAETDVQDINQVMQLPMGKVESLPAQAFALPSSPALVAMGARSMAAALPIATELAVSSQSAAHALESGQVVQQATHTLENPVLVSAFPASGLPRSEDATIAVTLLPLNPKGNLVEGSVEVKIPIPPVTAAILVGASSVTQSHVKPAIDVKTARVFTPALAQLALTARDQSLLETSPEVSVEIAVIDAQAANDFPANAALLAAIQDTNRIDAALRRSALATPVIFPSGALVNRPVPRRTIAQEVPSPAPTGNGSENPGVNGSAGVDPDPAPPDYLNPLSNPLQFPTKPDEVRVAGTQPISLKQAIDLARRNNRDLEVARLQLESATAAVREARAAQFPTVDLSGNLTFQDSASAELSNRRSEARSSIFFTRQSTTSTTVTATIEVAYNLDISGARSATIQIAERQLRLQELAVEQTEEEIRLTVSGDYYSLQEADEQVRISQAAVDAAQKSLEDAQALERAGVGTRFDVLRAEVQLANSQQDLILARSQQRIARRQLAQRLSLPQSLDVAAADPVEIAGVWSQTLEESILQAYKNRSELEQRLVQREIGEAQRRLALAAIRPQVSLFANYTGLGQFDDGVGPADGYAAGVRLNWNIFDGGAARAQARQRELDINIAETQFANVRDQVRFQVEQSYYTLQANFRNIETASRALEQARESLRLARLRFQAGVGTQTDVINAETELTRAEVNRLRAILDYNRALASLQRAISNIPGDGSSRPLRDPGEPTQPLQ